jgi:hypothetical protein
MSQLGKALLGIGFICVAIGVILLVAARVGLPLGRLPGDISYRGKNVSVFVPLGTCVLISVVVSAILYLLSHFRR